MCRMKINHQRDVINKTHLFVMCRIKINHQRDVQCAFRLGPLARMQAVFFN